MKTETSDVREASLVVIVVRILLSPQMTNEKCQMKNGK
jgi:hypothetical protein